MCVQNTLRTSFYQIALLPLLICLSEMASGQSGNRTGTSVWADSCVSSSFVGTININTPNSFSTFRNVHEYPGGDIIVIGSIRPNLPGVNNYQVYGLIMRLSRSGQIKWGKYIGYNDPDSTNDYRLYASVITQNKDIVVVSLTDIIRFDPFGNIIWKRKLARFSFTYTCEQIMETSENGFLLAGSSFLSGNIIKTNSRGILVWKRTFSLDSYLNCRSIAETPSAYYFTGYSYYSYSEYSQNLLVKLNKQTGEISWVKSFGKATAMQGFTEYAFDWMEYRNGRLYLTGNTSINYRGNNKAAQSVIIFNESGDLLDAKRIENTAIAVQSSSVFRSRLFDIATHSGLQYSDEAGSDIHLYRLNSEFKQIWAWRHPIPDRESVDDMQVLNDSSLAVCGTISTLPPNWNERAFLLKTSEVGKLNNCINLPFETVVTNYTVNVSPISINFGPSDIEITDTSFTPVFEISGFQWQLTCSSESVCRLSKIEGNRMVCAGTSSTYKVTRDGACQNPVTFSLSNSMAQIQKDSDTSVNVVFNKSGTTVLYVRTQTSCGILQDSIFIQATHSPGPVNLGPDNVICGNNTLLLHGGDGYISYRWQDGSVDSILAVTQPGTYSLEVQDACGGVFKDTIVIVAHPQILLDIGPDRVKCNNDTLHLTAPTNFKSYFWSNQSISKRIIVTQPGLYWLRVTDSNNCIGIDSLFVIQKECSTGLYVPNAFTPNRDGRNDVFKPILWGNIENYEFIVYNRWGQVVFRSKKPNQGWDGTVNGKSQETGVFLWFCLYQLKGEDKKAEKGVVTLIR